MLSSTQLERALERLEARFGLDVLWLFGSEAKGTPSQGSDLDLAALFHTRPSPELLAQAEAEVSALLGRDVDLIDLDRTSPILAMQVLRHGRLLLDRDPRRRLAFFSRTVSQYEDIKILRRDAERALLQRLASGRS